MGDIFSHIRKYPTIGMVIFRHAVPPRKIEISAVDTSAAERTNGIVLPIGAKLGITKPTATLSLVVSGDRHRKTNSMESFEDV
jgi:hypothetical protein